MNRVRRVLTALLLALLGTAIGQADDWPQWRGPLRDGVWREDGILEQFPTTGLTVRWRAPIGAGYSGPSVADGRVYLLDRVTQSDPDTEVKFRWDFRDKTMGLERVLCLDAVTGKILWTHSYLCKYSVAYGNGPRATPTVRAGKIYTLGAMGDLFCLDAATGKEAWQKNLSRAYNVPVPLYGCAVQPLVEGDRLFLTVGGSNQAVVTLNPIDGKEIWKTLSAAEPGYSAPQIRTLAEQRQLIVWHSEGLAGLTPDTGRVLWSIPHATKLGMSLTTPAIEGDRLALSSQYEGALMLQFNPGPAAPKILWQASTGGAPEKEWKKAGFNTTFSTVLLLENFLYGVSLYGELCCLNGSTGERVWTTLAATSGGSEPKERWCAAFMVPHRDRVFIFNEKGDLILCRLSPKGYQEICRTRLLEPDMTSAGTGGRKVVWAHPAFANRCVYARNNHELVCVSLAANP
jgi:outer membrane protein assembly factor BamB